MLRDIALTRTGFLKAAGGLLAITFLVSAICMYALGMSVTWRELGLAAAATAFVMGISHIYYVWRPEPRLCAIADTSSFLLCMTVALIVASYVAVACGGALWDNEIAAVDRMLGFDWLAHFNYLADRPTLMVALGYVYNSSIIQPGLVIAVLSFTDQLPRLRLFMLLYGLCALEVVLLSGLFPTIGAFDHYLPGVPAAATVHDHIVGPRHLVQFLGLRDGSTRLIVLSTAEGLVSFPSFHTALSVLFAWALFRTRYIAWTAVLLNAAVIFSTLSIGGHYLFDVLGGGLLALATIAALAGFALPRPRQSAQPLAGELAAASG